MSKRSQTRTDEKEHFIKGTCREWVNHSIGYSVELKKKVRLIPEKCA